MDLDEIRKRLIEAGADPEAVQELDPEDLEELDENANFEFLAKVINFLDYLDHVEKYKRKRVNMTLAEPVHALLKHIASGIVDAEGKPYPVSYLMEDMIIWVLKDLDRFNEFLSETYGEEDGTEEETESEES